MILEHRKPERPSDFYILEGENIVATDFETWRNWRNNHSLSQLAQTYIDPGFWVFTEFVGMRLQNGTVLHYKTTVYNDLGERSCHSGTLREAVLIHNGLVMDLQDIVKHTRWTELKSAV